MGVEIILSGALCNCLHISRNFWELGVVSGNAARSVDIPFAFNLYRNLLLHTQTHIHPPASGEDSQEITGRCYVTVRQATLEMTGSNLYCGLMTEPGEELTRVLALRSTSNLLTPTP